MFDALFNGLAWLLNFFYELVPNYAFAIGALTVVVYLATFPLTAKSMRSMAAMSKLAPEIRQLQQKYKDDRQKQSEEMMALYKAHKVSPLGGCIPLLVQWPIFIVMFRVLSGLTYKPKGAETFAPKYLDHGSKLFEVLDQSSTMKSFGIDLAKNATEAAKVSFTTAIPFFLLIAGVVATGYWQQAMISRRNPQAADDDNPVARQMRIMTRFMPLMYLVFGFTFPAGLNVYFFISALVRIGQQTLIYKLDPTLLPGRGLPQRQTASVVETTSKPTKAESPKPKAGGSNGAPPAKPNGRVTPPASQAGGSRKKKKKRR